ncbi:Lrp/AsnC family transcriptional regulator [Candidatus Woesearchaeota archaeon]|nr:Lrp/AsnC family transcriptional regulator [Candidatus Woesearchaeota archaeon]
MKKDLLIVAHLRKNGRETLTNMSKKTNIPISTIYERLKHNDVITRHTALLDFSKLGYKARANVLIKLSASARDGFIEAMNCSSMVNTVYRVNNGFDFMVEVLGRDHIALEQYVADLETRFLPEKLQVHYILGTLAHERFLSDPSIIYADATVQERKNHAVMG